MIKNFEIRRWSLFIFIFILSLAMILIHLDFKNHVKVDKKIDDYIATIEKIEKKNDKTYIYSNNAIIRSYSFDDEYKVGDILLLDGKIQDNLSLENKSYGLYLKSRGYDYSINASHVDIIGEKNSFSSLIYSARQSISSCIDYIYPDYNGIIKALTVSDRQNITDEDTDLFSKVGISHIISISGFHIVLVSGIFFSLLFFLPKKQRYVISAIITFFYVAITGFNPPCVRAYVFYITYISSILLQKKYDIFSVGFLLASFYIALNPYIIFNIGFCLSFMCVFSIAMFYKKLLGLFKKAFKKSGIKYNDVWENILSALAVTISSSILTMPYLYYNIGIVSLVAVFSNVISIPVISMVYPFIMLSILTMKIPFLSLVFANVTNLLLTIFYGANRFLSGLPFAYLSFEEKYLYPVLLLYILIFLLYRLYISYKIQKNKFQA